MLRKMLFSMLAATLMVLAMPSNSEAWFAYHYGGYGGAHYGAYHYGGYGGASYGAYHYGGYGGAHYGYVRRW